jgi:perosamine synthetase
LRQARAHGQTGKYYHTSLGFNYRMTDVEAAIGRAQLTRLDSMLVARRSAAAILLDGGSRPPRASRPSRPHQALHTHGISSV